MDWPRGARSASLHAALDNPTEHGLSGLSPHEVGEVGRGATDRQPPPKANRILIMRLDEAEDAVQQGLGQKQTLWSPAKSRSVNE